MPALRLATWNTKQGVAPRQKAPVLWDWISRETDADILVLTEASVSSLVRTSSSHQRCWLGCVGVDQIPIVQRAIPILDELYVVVTSRSIADVSGTQLHGCTVDCERDLEPRHPRGEYPHVDPWLIFDGVARD